jgi:hypothetical protein
MIFPTSSIFLAKNCFHAWAGLIDFSINDFGVSFVPILRPIPSHLMTTTINGWFWWLSMAVDSNGLERGGKQVWGGVMRTVLIPRKCMPLRRILSHVGNGRQQMLL